MGRIFRAFKSKKKDRNYPIESHLLTNSMQVDVWVDKSENGSETVLWSISRVDSSDESKSYRRLTIDQLIDELPLFIAKVSAAFSGIDSLSTSQKESLHELALAFADIVKSRQMNGEEKASDKRSVLGF